MKTAEEILGESCYPHECGSMVEVVSKENALKAMEEYAAQFKEQKPRKTKGMVIQCPFCKSIFYDCTTEKH